MRVRDLLEPASTLILPLLLTLSLQAQSDSRALSGRQTSSGTEQLLLGWNSAFLESGFNIQGPATQPGAAPDSDSSGSATVNTSWASLAIDKSSAANESCASPSNSERQTPSSAAQQSVPDDNSDLPGENVKATSALVAQHPQRPDRNLDIYYRNRREFSLDVGWHPVNIPFIYDFAVGDSYNMTPLKYTLVPIIASLRWHVTSVGWRWIFRGNMDFTFSGSITAIPRGPETHYYSLDFGIRRNFVYRNWKIVPFFEQRGGAGIINAKEPLGVQFAQGQNLTFTYDLGVGVRYNKDSKYSFSAGMKYMHISNGYLSEPKFDNYGINVYGPMVGFDMRIGKAQHGASQ
jgi:Lipid A 3-O-deacylase (PagL)